VAPADLAEIVRLYGLRMWVEQSYKQVKHRLGWSQYQVRSDRAMRRHWELVCCAFCFCWWAHGATLPQEPAMAQLLDNDATAAAPLAREKNPAARLLAGGTAAGAQLAPAVAAAHALVAGLVATAPTGGVAEAAGHVVARPWHPAL
jgi:hypothetical protein